MRYINFYILIVGFFLTPSCTTKTIKEYTPDKKTLLKEYKVLRKNEEIKHGKYIAFYENGKPLEIATYNKGKLDGERTLYYENGTLMITEHYKNNLMEGNYTSYFEHGGKQQEGNYTNNMMIGEWLNYYEHPKNIIKTSYTLEENKINGLYKEYNEKGILLIEGTKIEVVDDVDVFDGKITEYDSISKKPIKTYIFNKGKLIQKDTVI